MHTPDPDALPPECQLIRDAREAMMPPVSQRQAARRGGMSDSTWQALEAGRRATGAAVATAAFVTGIEPQQLDGAGRPDAARKLRTLMRKRAAGAPGPVREAADADAPAALDGVLAQIVEGLADVDGDKRLTARQKSELRAELIEGIMRDIGERRRSNARAVLRIAQNDA